MKNPLADALREAQTKESSESGEKAQGPEEQEISLLSTGSHDFVHLSELSAGEAAVAPPSTETVAEYPDLSTRSLSAATVNGVSTGISGVRREAREDRLPFVEIVARISPLLCMVALIMSAAGYVLIGNLSGMNLNEDLPDRNSRMQSEVNVADTANSFLAFATRDVASNVSINADRTTLPSIDLRDAGIPLTHNTSSVQRDMPPPIERNSSLNSYRTARNARAVEDGPTHDLLRAAFAAYQAAEYAEAEELYIQLLEVEANHVPALAGIAAVYHQLGKSAEAERVYRKLLALDPDNMPAVAGLWTLRSADADVNAVSELKHLLQRHPESPHLYFALGKYHVEHQKWPDATQAFLMAHSLAPHNSAYSYNSAVSLEKSGNHELARRYYNTALQTADDNSNFDRNAIAAHLATIDSGRSERL